MALFTTILGSGLSGYTLAREIRKIDSEIPLRIITADDGVYYSKPQLSSAFTHHKTAENLTGASATQMAKQLKAEIITNTSIQQIIPSQKKICSQHETFFYDQLILAQGAEVITPKLNLLNPDAHQRIVSINNLMDYQHFRTLLINKKRVAILGAGLVGCEFANDLANGGFEVNLIALSKSPLDLLLPPPLGEILKNEFSQIGIHTHFEQSIQAIDYQTDQLQLTLTNNKTIVCDLLITAIGLKPMTELAQISGIYTQRGICVDHYLQTNIENIYALGDCAEVVGHVLLYVAPLVICARALAQTLTGNKTAVRYPPMPVIVKTAACPAVANPPLKNMSGEWHFSGQGKDQTALFYDFNNQLQGFALTGPAVSKKLELMKELPFLV